MAEERGSNSKGLLVALLLMSSALAGCRTLKPSPTGRSAAEQYLIARTVEDAIMALEVGSRLEGRVLSVEVRAVGGEKDLADLPYLREAIRAWARIQGAAFAEDRATSEATAPNGSEETESKVAAEEPDLRVEFLVQSLGSDLESSRWEIPIILPTLETGLSVSRISIYRNDVQVSRCHMWAYAMEPDGTVAWRQPAVFSTHYLGERELLGLTLGKRTDLSELKAGPSFRLHPFRKRVPREGLDGVTREGR